MSKRSYWTLLIILATVALYFLPLGRRCLWEPDEPHHALLSQGLLDDGFRLFPYRDGKPNAAYGPLYFWTTAAIATADGQVSDTIVILPSLVSALLLLGTVFFLGKELGGERLGWLAAGVLASTPNFFWQSQTALIDMPLALFVALSHLAFLSTYRHQEKETSSWLWVFVALFFAWLTKGPVSFILVALPIALFLGMRRDFVAIRKWGIRFFVFSTVLAGLWYGLAYWVEGKEFFLDLFLNQTLGRFATNPAHPQPVYYYFLYFPWQFLPWVCFLPFAALRGEKALKEDDRFFYPLCWFLGILLFFSVASGKRRDYLIPLYPAVALLIARGLEQLQFIPKKAIASRAAAGVGAFLCISLGFALAVLEPALEKHRPELAGLLGFSVLPFIAASFVAAAWFIRGTMFLQSIHLVFTLLIVLISFGCFRTLPLLDHGRSWRCFIERIESRLRSEDRVVYFNSFRESFRWYGCKKFLGQKLNDVDAFREFWRRKNGAYLLIVREEDRVQIKDYLKDLPLILQQDVKGDHYEVYAIEI